MSTTPPQEDQQLPSDSRYRDMEHHELIHLLDDIDDERSKARFRESIYISVIVWLVLLLVLRYGPHYLWKQPHVITEIRPDEQKQFTMLNLPPDMVKRIPRVKPAPQIAERDQTGQSPQPAPTPPQPSPGERTPSAPQQQATPQPQQQQQAHNQPPPPRPQQQPPLIDTPRPAPQQTTKPNFSTGMSAGEQIRQAARDARGGATRQYGDNGDGPKKMGGGAGVQVLSDTMGVDFSRYLARLKRDVERNWYPLIPEECKPPILKQGITDVRFTINRDGSIAAMNLDLRSGDVAIDKAAWGSITSLGQAQPLPPEFKGQNLVLRFEFQINKDYGGVQ